MFKDVKASISFSHIINDSNIKFHVLILNSFNQNSINIARNELNSSKNAITNL